MPDTTEPTPLTSNVWSTCIPDVGRIVFDVLDYVFRPGDMVLLNSSAFADALFLKVYFHMLLVGNKPLVKQAVET